MTLICATALVSACSGSTTTVGGTTDGGAIGDGSGSGTSSDTGGGTCSLATTCIGPFFGTCFDGTGACTIDSTKKESCYANGAKLVDGAGGTAAIASNGTTCYTVQVGAGGSFTFTNATGTLAYVDQGNQTRVSCADGSKVNFTAAAFRNSDCASVEPPTNCTPGACP